MLKLEARAEPSNAWTYGSPLLALLVTVVIGTIMFTALGKDPLKGLEMFFWQPIHNAYALGELMVKATPLLIIALGLAVCFRSTCGTSVPKGSTSLAPSLPQVWPCWQTRKAAAGLWLAFC